MSPVVWGIAAYVALQLAIGVIASRRVSSEEDFFVAGRRLGYPLAVFSIFATWFGAETCVGSAGSVYGGSVGSSPADPFGYSLCLLLMGVFFARALWEKKLTTLGDLFRERFSPRVEKLAVLLMVPSSLLWGAAQIRAFGQVLSVSSGIGTATAITIAAVVAVVYTGFGGLFADAATDFVQGVVLVAGLIVLGVAVVWELGGLTSALHAIEPARLSLRPREVSGWKLAESWVTPVLGSVFAQELVSRVIACRSPTVARRSTLLAAALYFSVGLIPIFIGLLGPRLAPGLADPEHLLAVVAEKHLSTALYVVFVGAVVSAILSTVDSTLLVAASLVAHNILVPLSGKSSEGAKLRFARVALLAMGLVTWALALGGESVAKLVEEASAFGGAGFFVVLLCALYTKLGGPVTAASCLASGALSYVAGEHLLHVEAPFLLSLAVSAGVYAAGVVLGRRRAPA